MPQQYDYKGQIYELPDGLSDKEALGKIKEYLQESSTKEEKKVTAPTPSRSMADIESAIEGTYSSLTPGFEIIAGKDEKEPKVEKSPIFYPPENDIKGFQDSDFERLTEEEPGGGYIGNRWGHDVWQTTTGKWYSPKEDGGFVEWKEDAKKQAMDETGGLPIPWFNPLEAGIAGGVVSGKLAMRAGMSLSQVLRQSTAGATAGAVGDIIPGMTGEFMEKEHPRLAVPFTILVGVLGGLSVDRAIERGLSRMGQMASPKKVSYLKKMMASGFAPEEVGDEFNKMIKTKMSTTPGMKVKFSNDPVVNQLKGIPKTGVLSAESLKELKSQKYQVLKDIKTGGKPYIDKTFKNKAEVDKNIKTIFQKYKIKLKAESIIDEDLNTVYRMSTTGATDDGKMIVDSHMNMYKQANVPLAFYKEMSPMAVGMAGGIGFDEDGITMNWTRGLALGASLMGYARVPIKGKTAGLRVSNTVSSVVGKLVGKYAYPFHPQLGVGDELWKVWQTKGIETLRMKHKGRVIAEGMLGEFTPEERLILSNIIEQEGDLSKATKKLMQDAERFQEMMKEIRTGMEKVGMLDMGVLPVGQDPDKYIHRVYDDVVDTSLKKYSRRKWNSIWGGTGIERGERTNLPVKKRKWQRGDKVTLWAKVSKKGHAQKKYQLKGLSQEMEEGGWTALKHWDVDNVVDGRISLHRDYTPMERKAMGENRDLAVRMSAYFDIAAKDIALGRMYREISKNPKLWSKKKVEGWVRVSNDYIPGTRNSVKKFGMAAGGYVSPETNRILKNSRPFWKYTGNERWNQFFKSYTTAMSYWKIGKTAWSPATHYNNSMSNIGMSILEGDNPVKIITDGYSSIMKKDAYFQEAVEHGLLDSSLIRGDFNVKVAIDELHKIKRVEKESQLVKFLFRPLKKGSRVPQRLYELEDEIFKVGKYIKSRKQGFSARDSLDKAYELYFNYADVPLGIQFLRDTAIIPFVSYPYKAIPTVVRKISENPHRALALYALFQGVNDYSYASLYGNKAEEQERLEREVMPEWMKGVGAPSVLWAPENVRLPWNREVEDVAGGIQVSGKFLDIGNIFPGGDVFEAGKPGWTFPWSSMLGQNPLVSTIIGLATNKDGWSGRKIVPYDNPKGFEENVENAKAMVNYMWKVVVPNNPLVPKTWSQDKLIGALVSSGNISPEVANAIGHTGKNYFGEAKDPIVEMLGIIGIKLKDVNVSRGLYFKLRDLEKKVRTETMKFNSMMRDERLSQREKEDKRLLYLKLSESWQRELVDLGGLMKGARDGN